MCYCQDTTAGGLTSCSSASLAARLLAASSRACCSSSAAKAAAAVRTRAHKRWTNVKGRPHDFMTSTIQKCTHLLAFTGLTLTFPEVLPSHQA